MNTMSIKLIENLCLVVIAVITLFAQGLEAQTNYWKIVDQFPAEDRTDLDRRIIPEKYQLLALNLEEMRLDCALAPHEKDAHRRTTQFEIELPMPDGTFNTYRLFAYDLFESKLARKYPSIRAYRGYDTSSGLPIFMNFTSNGFHAAMQTDKGLVYIDPYAQNNAVYFMSYFTKDHVREDAKNIGCAMIDEEEAVHTKSSDLFRGGPAKDLFVYRAAISTTQGYCNYHGGTVQSVLDAIGTTLNRINMVYEVDNAIRMVLVDDNDKLVHLDGDDYNQGNLGQMISLNQEVIDDSIGRANYDIGHVWGNTNYQGLASLSSVCNNRKAMGASILNNPVGDRFAINLISHEMGHQFSATHTMYHCHNVTTGTAYEIGSGSTIMAYTGICSGTNLQTNSDPYFHIASLEQIQNYSRGNGACATVIDVSNTAPEAFTVFTDDVIQIPINTPYILEGYGTDMEDTDLSYNWEQYQAGSRDYESNPWDLENPLATEPMVRSLLPGSSPVRYIPALPTVVANSYNKYEQLPKIERDIIYRFNVRDNHPDGGAWASKLFKIHANVVSTQGDFDLTCFNSRDTVYYGGYEEITWDVAGTMNDPINTMFVDIYYSIDKGLTFPYQLAEATLNDGSAWVTIPNIPADKVRFMVRAHDNIYYQVNNRSAEIFEQSQPNVMVNISDHSPLFCADQYKSIKVYTDSIGGYADSISITIDQNTVPDGVRASLSKNVVFPGDSLNLILNTYYADYNGKFDLILNIEGKDLPTQTRIVETMVIDSKFSDLDLLSPENGAVGVAEGASFSWTKSDNAMSYTFELSTDPDFSESSIVIQTDPIQDSFYVLNQPLEQGTQYFWRVKAENKCGIQDLRNTYAFQTRVLDCQDFVSSSSPQILTSNGTPEITIPINTGGAVSVNELKVTSIIGSHQNIGDLTIFLSGPSGTEIQLFDRSCNFITATFDMGFDDNSALVPNCLAWNQVFKPTDPLSTLSGESGSEFVLRVKDNSATNSGQIDSWAFQVCGGVAIDNPVIANAQGFELPKGDSYTITPDELEATHPDYSASEITITLVETTQFGSLKLEGVDISSGDSFSMQDVQDGKLAYLNWGSNYPKDAFSFIAETPNQGFAGTPQIPITIRNTFNTDDTEIATGLTMLPNPSDDFITLSWNSETSVEQIKLFNLQGQLMRSFDVETSTEFKIDIQPYVPGVYLIQIESNKGIITKKAVVK